MAPVFADLFNTFCRVKSLPACWVVSCISPIPKPKADTSTCGGHRGIVVGTLPARLYAAVLNRRIQSWAEKAGVRAEGQFGFRRGRNCSQATMCCEQLLRGSVREGPLCTLALWISKKLMTRCLGIYFGPNWSERACKGGACRPFRHYMRMCLCAYAHQRAARSLSSPFWVSSQGAP